MLDTFNGIIEKNRDIMDRIARNDFVTAMNRGVLENRDFVRFLEQDRLFLKEHSGSIAILSSRMTDPESSRTLLSLSQGMFDEYMFHHQLLSSLGEINNSGMETHNEPIMTNLSYVSFLYRTCNQAATSKALAAILPCSITYYEIGSRYRKTAHAKYRPWFSYYGSSEQKSYIEDLIAVYDGLDHHDSGDERIFRLAANYELRFWEMSLMGESWI